MALAATSSQKMVASWFDTLTIDTLDQRPAGEEDAPVEQRGSTRLGPRWASLWRRVSRDTCAPPFVSRAQAARCVAGRQICNALEWHGHTVLEMTCRQRTRCGRSGIGRSSTRVLPTSRQLRRVLRSATKRGLGAGRTSSCASFMTAVRLARLRTCPYRCRAVLCSALCEAH